MSDGVSAKLVQLMTTPGVVKVDIQLAERSGEQCLNVCAAKGASEHQVERWYEVPIKLGRVSDESLVIALNALLNLGWTNGGHQ